jgi:hypothetical protein
MFTLQFITAVCLFLSSQNAVSFKEQPQADDCLKIELSLSLKGEMKVQRDGKMVAIPMIATANHHFEERVIHLSTSGIPDKVARNYSKAEALFNIEGNKSERTLRKQRSLIVAQKPENSIFVYSPKGPLTREELELTGEHFDTLSMANLIPDKGPVPKEAWKLKDATVQAICNFEGLSEHTITGKVISNENGLVTFKIEGTATGVESGASVSSTVDATGIWNEKTSRITNLSWKQSDNREAGPVNPASKTEMEITIKREVLETPQTLNDAALVSIPQDFDVPNLMTYVEFKDQQGRFDLSMSRDWQLVAKTENHLVLRLVEKGDFIAQATVSVWSKAEPGKHLSVAEFKNVTERTPGWVVEKDLQEGEVPSGDKGRWVYRISALGQLDNVPTMQNYYVVASPGGEQVVVTFSLSPKQAEKLGTKDLSLIGSLELPGTSGK